MNKTLLTGIGIFVVIIIGLLMPQISDANAQSILSDNSNINISNILYSINISELSVEDSHNQNYYNDTNTTIITNITNTIDYSCILDADNINYTTTGAALAFNYFTLVNVSLTNPLSNNYYSVNLNCAYYINTTTVITNITENNTLIDTLLFLNTTIVNSNKNLLVDLINPLIFLTEFNNTNIALNNNTNGSINLTFADISEMNCSINIISNTNQNVYFNQLLLNSTNITLPINIVSNISPNSSVNYSINSTCIDKLGNIGILNTIIPVYNNTLVYNNSNITNITIIPFINVTTSKTSFGLGEIGYYTINAINNSNVTITICPVAIGWVQCYVAPTFVNDTFPKTQALPYTNKTGTYILQAVLNYNNQTLITNTTYTTINTLTAPITISTTKAGVGDIIIFNSTANSGVGVYKYRWVMHDGSIFNGPGAFKVYTTAGTYRVNLTVNDSVGNNYTTYVDLVVKDYYTLSVIVSDKATNTRINTVNLEITNQTKLTDGNGVATFRLLSDDYRVRLSKDNYLGYSTTVDVDSDKNVYLNMTFQDLSSPTISLLTDNNKVMSKGSVDLKFKAQDSTPLDCLLYIAKSTDSWYALKDSGEDLLSNTEYTFELRDLDNDAYKWKIECADSNGNKAYSDERKFIVSDGSVTVALNSVSGSVDQINNALDNMNKLSGAESEVANILNINRELKNLLDSINTYDRDISDLAYRRDLDELGKKKAQKDLTEKIEFQKNNIPIDLAVVDSKTFVKYVHDEDLKTILDEYVLIKNMKIDKKLFLESTKLVQSKIIVSTDVRNVKLYYLDGEIRDITLVTKTIQVIKEEDIAPITKSNSITFLEVIPKSIVQSVKELNFINKDYSVIKEDPIIEYPSDTSVISYYINETINPEKFQDSDTVLVEKNTFAVKSGTGFSIIGFDSLSNVELTGQTVMIILIILLILFYIVLNFELVDKMRSFITKIGLFGSGKKISFIRVLVNDAQDYIKNGDYDKASLIYREIKLSYEEANDYVRSQVYDDSFNLCNQLDYNYAMGILDKTEYYIKQNNRNNALMEFDKLEKIYSKLSDDYRTQIYDKFKKVTQLITTNTQR